MAPAPESEPRSEPGSGQPRIPTPWTRREFISSTALFAALPRTGPADEGPIDCHAHVWSADTVRWPRVPGLSGADAPPADFPPETLLDHARRSGVTRVVLIQRGFYLYDNGYMLDVLARHPGRFSAVARVDHTLPGAAAQMRRLAGLGVRGFRIVPAGQPRTWLDAPGMDALWTFAAEQRIAICPLIDPDALPALERMCDRHPGTPVAIDHLCRIGADGVFRDPDIRSLCQLARRPQVNVKVSAFHALGRKAPPYLDLVPLIRRVFDAYGARRLMWGTDAPFAVLNGNTYAAAFELVRDHLDFLSGEDRAWMLGRTAERVFFA